MARRDHLLRLVLTRDEMSRADAAELAAYMHRYAQDKIDGAHAVWSIWSRAADFDAVWTAATVCRATIAKYEKHLVHHRMDRAASFAARWGCGVLPAP